MNVYMDLKIQQILSGSEAVIQLLNTFDSL